MTLQELIRSIHGLENYLKKFEERYHLRSEDFYDFAIACKLEQPNDFIEWLGLYEIKQKREQKYRQRVAELLHQQKENLHLPLNEPVPA